MGGLSVTGDQVRAELRQLGHSDRPIVIGPWLSEVGFELLYWIPFLRWAIKVGHLQRERLWILSRGGCRSWYADMTAHYLDLFELHSPAEIVRMNQARIAEQAKQGPRIGLRSGQRSAKQCFLSGIERDLVANAARRAGLKAPHVLHPSLMYTAFRPPWRRRQKAVIVDRWAEMAMMAPLVPPPAPAGLPETYVAVKFYASQACPNTSERQAQVRTIVRTIAETTDVVLLHTGTRYDEHGEFAIPDHPRIHRPRFEATSNLDQQTAIIGGAAGFVGTYGGFAYLAPFLGVPTLACFAVDNFRHDHLTVMQALALQLNTAFRVLPLEDGVRAVKAQHKAVAHAA